MSIGTGVFLFVVGAILFFAVHVQVASIDLSTVGLILMGAGVVVFVVGIALLFVRRRSVSTSSTSIDGEAGRRTTTRTSDSDF